jgi:hypothetical protein
MRPNPAHFFIFSVKQNHIVMEKNNDNKKSGPKDRSYVNKSQQHEVTYEKSRKTPPKKFGTGKKD